jgi:TonB family protein
MSVAAAWVLYCGAISLVITAAAAAWQGAARWSGQGTRWGWLTALLASVSLPALLRLVPRHTWPEPVAATLPSIPVAPQVQPLWPVAMDPLYVTVVRPGSWGVTEYALMVWVALSLVGVALVLYAMASIGASRRFWRAREVDGERVYVSASTGPAALGVWRCAVVVPQWALELQADLRRLLLMHEREHVRAGDPRLLFIGLLCVAAMPWNPLVWYQLRRLRDALELDCDARVLAGGADPRVYGSLLLEMGRRGTNGTLLMATFAEPRTFLEERIRQIAGWPGRRDRRRAAAWSLVALLLFATAVSARDPLRAGPPSGATLLPLAGSAAEETAQVDAHGNLYYEMELLHAVDPDRLPLPETVRIPLMVSDTPPPPPPPPPPITVRPELRNHDEVQRALLRAYPPLLRDAGIGGTPMVWFHVGTDGRVARTQVGRSSGYPALDQAALSVASIAQFSPAREDGRAVEAWVELPIAFGNAAVPDRVARDGVTLLEALRVDGGRGAAPEPPVAELTSTRRVSPEILQMAERGPVFTPMTKRPEVRNHMEVQRALVRDYPPMLRDAGIGGTPVLWFLIDADGNVVITRLSRASGHPALDEAAVNVGRAMQFTPALNRDQPVAVWVEIPVLFTAR